MLPGSLPFRLEQKQTFKLWAHEFVEGLRGGGGGPPVRRVSTMRPVLIVSGGGNFKISSERLTENTSEPRPAVLLICL